MPCLLVVTELEKQVARYNVFLEHTTSRGVLTMLRTMHWPRQITTI